jgi:hypothetical protein
MNACNNRIDQSVNLSAQNTKDTNTRNWKGYAPLFFNSRAEQLKSALVKKFSAEYAGVATQLVNQAVNEAYALVSLTPEPLLLLPALAEEKVQSAAAWTARQRSLPWLRSFALMA